MLPLYGSVHSLAMRRNWHGDELGVTQNRQPPHKELAAARTGNEAPDFRALKPMAACRRSTPTVQYFGAMELLLSRAKSQQSAALSRRPHPKTLSDAVAPVGNRPVTASSSTIAALEQLPTSRAKTGRCEKRGAK